MKSFGETLTRNQLAALAEEVPDKLPSNAHTVCYIIKAGQEFELAYDSIEKLKRMETAELPDHVALYNEFPKQHLQQFLPNFELWTTDGETTCMNRKAR
ncbi:Hypothetical predicted protein [Lecanosticta acicola]|uniref:Uncharacterized protein n=1 Tax=Lecanosticta acicola TaxID=111012 RepID=A0AAI9E9V0_9PEZI|nr:Hypothetical predicted protein [Lecanosticta acicola]